MAVFCSVALSAIAADPNYNSMTLAEMAIEIEKTAFLSDKCNSLLEGNQLLSLNRYLTGGEKDKIREDCASMSARQIRDGFKNVSVQMAIDADLSKIEESYQQNVRPVGGLPPSREEVLRIMEQMREIEYISEIKAVFMRMLRYEAFAESRILRRAAIKMLEEAKNMSSRFDVNEIKREMLDAIAKMTAVFDCGKYFKVENFPRSTVKAITFKVPVAEIADYGVSNRGTIFGLNSLKCPVDPYITPGMNLSTNTFDRDKDVISLRLDRVIKGWADLQCQFADGSETCLGYPCRSTAQWALWVLIDKEDNLGQDLELPIVSYCARKMLNR
jgi:hypothetical protein